MANKPTAPVAPEGPPTQPPEYTDEELRGSIVSLMEQLNIKELVWETPEGVTVDVAKVSDLSHEDLVGVHQKLFDSLHPLEEESVVEAPMLGYHYHIDQDNGNYVLAHKSPK